MISNIFNPLQPFVHPFLNWGLPTNSCSPLSSSPNSTITTVLSRQNSFRQSAFTIDAILGSRHHEEVSIGTLNRSHKKEERRNHYKNSPYPTEISNSSQKDIDSCSRSCHKSKIKRVRTIFTAEQLERLETEFARQQYMVGPERLYLAATLRLTEAQVKVWFQNRRIKWRKQYIENQHAKFTLQSDEDVHSHENSVDASGSNSPPSSLPVSPPAAVLEESLNVDENSKSNPEIPQIFLVSQSEV